RAYAKEKIYLVGHSWGTVLGLVHAKAHPEAVAALICVAPVVSFSEQQRRAYAFDLAEAKHRGETGTLEELRKLGEPPYETVDKANALERITTRYGGVDFEPRSRTAIVVHGVRPRHAVGDPGLHRRPACDPARHACGAIGCRHAKAGQCA